MTKEKFDSLLAGLFTVKWHLLRIHGILNAKNNSAIEDRATRIFIEDETTRARAIEEEITRALQIIKECEEIIFQDIKSKAKLDISTAKLDISTIFHLHITQDKLSVNNL